MVQKFGKFGVRSGNSLKGSNSKYFRRYRRDALVYRESFNVNTSATSPETVIGQTDVSTDDVPYSLNKMGRWTLPDELKRAILTGQLHREEFGVQLVELHKINKSANCVAVYATRGPVGKLAIQKRKRTRHRKRTGYMQAKSIINAKPDGVSKRRRRHLQRCGLPIQEENANVDVEPGHVRYEFVYPSPVTSSVTHNPKYIGHDTTKTQVRIGHKRRRRKHHAEFISEEMFDMEQRFDESEDEDCYHDDEISPVHPYPRQDTLQIGDIVNRTCATSARRRFKKEGRMNRKTSNAAYEQHKRTRVIYSNVEREKAADIENVDVSIPNTEAVNVPEPLSEPVYVCLRVEDVSQAVLRETYGETYIEAECLPRKFVIDISEMESRTKLFPNAWKYCPDRINANVVFVYDVNNKVNTENVHIYKVFLSTKLRNGISPMRIETLFDYMETTVGECLKRSLFFMETLADQLEINTTCTIYGKHGPSVTEELAKWDTSSYLPNNSFVYKTFYTDSKRLENEQSQMPSTSIDVCTTDETDFGQYQKNTVCSVCYEILDPTEAATALKSCGHWFCDVCWKEYLLIQVRSGATSLSCPEFDCDKVADPGTIMSLLSMKDIIRFAKCCHDTKVEQQEVAKWCPNEKCGRVIKVNSEQVEIVKCACGQNLCFKCNAKTHWPASCDTAKVYAKKLRDEGIDDTDDIDEPGDLIVFGRNCPSCKRFVEKNGGCPFMSCICKKPFCWGCGKPWGGSTNGHSQCYSNGSKNRHTGTVKKKVKPIIDKLSKAGATNEAASRLFETAVQHRKEQHRQRVKQMRGAAKDLCKKLQLFVDRAMWKGERITLDETVSPRKGSHESADIHTFLDAMISLHKEVNQIAEYTAVLLLGPSVPGGNLVKFLNNLLCTFQCYSLAIHENIVRGHDMHPRDVIKNLTDARFHSVKAIEALVKRTKIIRQA